VAVDVRIIAATHRDLAERVAAGAFREDLLYRLKVVELHIPPLRDRPADIALLGAHFLDLFAERFGVGPVQMSEGLRAALEGHDWPGNVRELGNAIESLVVLSPPGALDLGLLPGGAGAGESQAQATLEDRLAAYERGVLVGALAAAGGNRSEAARSLGIGRATLYEKLKKHGIGRADGSSA